MATSNQRIAAAPFESFVRCLLVGARLGRNQKWAGHPGTRSMAKPVPVRAANWSERQFVLEVPGQRQVVGVNADRTAHRIRTDSRDSASRIELGSPEDQAEAQWHKRKILLSRRATPVGSWADDLKYAVARS